MWSFRDTVVTSFICAHMLSVTVLVIMRQPMNFNGMGYGFELHGQTQKTIAFSSSFFFSPFFCLYSAAVSVQ